MNPRFTITLTKYHWSCGDGCCSDSGYKLYVEDHTPEIEGYSCVAENSDWRSNGTTSPLLESALECIKEKIGRVPVEGTDYEIVKDHEDSDDDDPYAQMD